MKNIERGEKFVNSKFYIQIENSGKQNNAFSPRMPIPISSEPVNAVCCYLTWQNSLCRCDGCCPLRDRGDYFELSGWARYNHNPEKQRTFPSGSQMKIWWWKHERDAWGWLWRWSQAKKCRQSLEAYKDKEMDSLPELLEKAQPCWCLGFSPVRLMLDFWTIK